MVQFLKNQSLWPLCHPITWTKGIFVKRGSKSLFGNIIFLPNSDISDVLAVIEGLWSNGWLFQAIWYHSSTLPHKITLIPMTKFEVFDSLLLFSFYYKQGCITCCVCFYDVQFYRENIVLQLLTTFIFYITWNTCVCIFTGDIKIFLIAVIKHVMKTCLT